MPFYLSQLILTHISSIACNGVIINVIKRNFNAHLFYYSEEEKKKCSKTRESDEYSTYIYSTKTNAGKRGIQPKLIFKMSI